MTKMTNIIKRAAGFLARPILLFYSLPWLMLLLVLGTVSQRYIGLYQSQKLFFGSFILWIGVIPLPGAYATLLLIALGLLAKLALRSPLRKHSAGTIISHISVLVLLIGGLVTATSREEGYMVLGKGESGNRVSDYHSREFVILKNGKALVIVPSAGLHKGETIETAQLPFSVYFSSYCQNCSIADTHSQAADRKGLAAKFDIAAAPLDTEDARNMAGALLEVTGAPQAEGTYLVSQSLNQQPEFTVGNDRYSMLLRQAERSIPFSLKLLRFEKAEYPGTEVARSYSSEVEVTDGTLKWNKVIEMNTPLRYRGYTFYQSSFVNNNGELSTVLAVVRNSGDIFPYIAITTLCIGLTVHLIARSGRRRAA